MGQDFSMHLACMVDNRKESHTRLLLLWKHAISTFRGDSAVGKGSGED